MKRASWPTARKTRQALALLALYVATAVFSLQWAVVQGAGAAIWIPAGVGMAGLAFFGLRLWPVIFLGRLLAGQLSGTEQPLWAEAVIAVGNTVMTVLGVWLFQGRHGPAPRLGEMQGMLRFLIGMALIPAAVSGVLGAASLYFSSELDLLDLPLVWVRWMFGNAASIMVIAGLALSWQQEPLPREKAWQFALMLAVNGVAAAFIFGMGPDLLLRTWHVYPVLIWAALQFGPLGAAGALLISGGLAVTGVIAGVGPFIDLDPMPSEALFYLQQYLTVTASTILLLAAVADERRGRVALEHARADLQRMNAELETRVQERTEELRRSQASLLQAQKMEAIGQLTGGIAHDFNNLLHTISNSFELIVRRSRLADEVVRYAERGKGATQRGVNLTRQLLTFSRMQALEKQPIELSSLLEGMMDLLRSTVGSGVTLKLELETAAGIHVLNDPTQLELMILNLAVNARDAMPSGGHLIIMATEEVVQGDAELADGRYARIQVRDSGHGMTPEVAARVFEPFFTTKGVGQGTGLGLSMVYGLAKQSSGTVRIESAPGQGTTLTVYLPVTDVRARDMDEPASGVPPLPAGLRVLLVDDDEGVRATLADMLKGLGCEVQEAASGAQALAVVERESFDLIVLDHTMPGMLGSEAVQKLRARDIKIPVVLVSGDLRLQIPADQALLVLRKPFDIADLQRAVDAALGGPAIQAGEA